MPVGDLDKMVEYTTGRINAAHEVSTSAKASKADTKETQKSKSTAEVIASGLGAGRVRAPRKDTRNSAAAKLANRLRGL
ncbi:hypothetical protein ABT286_21755 [Streptomyces rochei]|uniref:hypothetical protein n=1 Tax=Streptomyces rochei TaxID=1928 RepID=UPI00177FBEEE